MTDRDTVATYQSVAEQYRQRHADRSGIRELVEQFLDALDDATGGEPGSVVDVGCGPGWESAIFAERGHEVVGVDLTPAFLRLAREEAPAASFARMDMRSLGLATDAVDGLWACASFLHVPRGDAPATLREFRRALRPGGVVCLSVKRGHGEREGDTYDEDGRQFTLYRAEELRELVADAGFEVESASGGKWIRLLARA
ncbi:class I SAM-dependent DNA methyltransferase [Halorussus halobius]|uniref:class I SAM-dependent DNA methyltransferase n=1 Tax=Halorussus halobius TaxID=1710537 RepID=UPI0010929277|nr:class I SAM-dependent methyltransferase [Halorussus halobius]